MKWNLKTIVLLFVKNLTGSGKWAKRYFISQGYRFHPTAIVGGNVVLDTQTPNRLTIEEGVVLGNGCRIIAHGPGKNGKITLGKNAFIGTGAIMLRSVGEGSVVGAGAVVTKEIPSGEVWAGNPARKLRDV